MPLGDEQWLKRNPDKFKIAFDSSDKFCDCGVKIVEKGEFFGLQDHPWHKPRIVCDCGKIHSFAAIKSNK